MNRYERRFLTFRRWACVFGGLLLIVFGGFYFFSVSAQTDTVEKPAAVQNLANGKLAFVTYQAGPTIPEHRIILINADGSGQNILPIPTSLEPTRPAWSPDGTNISFAGAGSTRDIFKINIDGAGGVINLTNTGNSIVEYNPTWSVTGKIAYQREGKIWVMNDDGSGQVQFPGITENSVYPAWSPDGTKLAYVAGSFNGGEIWVINADGTNKQQLTMNGANKHDPAWSPDGTKIIFSSSTSGIAVINADGTNETILAGGTNPSWSPDGTKIAYYSGGIRTMDADGNNQVTVVPNTIRFPQCCDTVNEQPAWQPVAQTPNTFSISGRITDTNLSVSGVTVNLSGTTNAAVTTDAAGNYQFSDLPAGGNYTVSPSFLRHYFTPAKLSFTNLSSHQTGNNFEVRGVCVGGKCVKNWKIGFVRGGDIYTIFPDGSAQTNITNSTATENHPNFSTDGANMLFTTNRDGNNEIYRMNLEDIPNPVRLTDNSASDRLPFYSPDDSTIVFVSNRDGNDEIYKMNSDGSNPVRLTNEPATDTYPAFSPDGQKIIFSSRRLGNDRLFTMNADGSNPQPIPDSNTPVQAYDRPSYSPDGSKIIFTYTPDASSQIRVTWTMNADGTNAVRFPADGSYGTYSPDGKSVAYTCCIFNNTNRLTSSDALGSAGSVRSLTPSNTGNTLPDWQGFLIRRAPFDFDGDGRSDISVFRPSNGAWYLLQSSAGLWVPVWGTSTDVLVPADYDGDLKTDVAVWRPSNGDFYILNSLDGTVRVENFGLAGDVPTGGDFDGDGKADLAVYRGGANGTFYYRGSMGNPQGNITFIPWGISGDKPVVGDFDGDGRTDAAVYRPSNGTWYVRQSSNGQLLGVNFGLAGDTLVPADYDADGKTDIAVYRAGTWYLLRSTQGFTAFQFGISDDIPAPADYDGDGRADAAIYRDGVWWILKSQSGAAEAIPFGLDTDAPVPAAFVR